jgi:hypothetical protein
MEMITNGLVFIFVFRVVGVQGDKMNHHIFAICIFSLSFPVLRNGYFSYKGISKQWKIPA